MIIALVNCIDATCDWYIIDDDTRKSLVGRIFLLVSKSKVLLTPQQPKRRAESSDISFILYRSGTSKILKSTSKSPVSVFFVKSTIKESFTPKTASDSK